MSRYYNPHIATPSRGEGGGRKSKPRRKASVRLSPLEKMAGSVRANKRKNRQEGRYRGRSAPEGYDL